VLPEVTWPEVMSVTWPEVTSVTCPVWKYVLRMRNRKLHTIRPSWAFWPEVALTGSMFCAWPDFPPRFFLSSSNMATGCDRRSFDPFGFLLGSCATLVVTEGHVTPSEVSMGCSLRRSRLIFSMVTETNHPRPIFSMVTGTILGYLPLLFSYSVYIGYVVLLLC
jgi:hypothetical protein